MMKFDESKRKDNATSAENELDKNAQSTPEQIVQGRNLLGKFSVFDFCIPVVFPSSDVLNVAHLYYQSKVPEGKTSSHCG